MSFKLFVYYCALCGGWAAFLAWVVLFLTGISSQSPSTQVGLLFKATLTGGVLGTLVAAAIGLVDALLNAVGLQRFLRVGLCLLLGLVAGAVGGFVGQLLNSLLGFPIVIGWILAGVLIGATIGVFDILNAVLSGQDVRASLKKMLNGIYGGFLGGFVGGLPFSYLMGNPYLPHSSLTISLVILGICIGFLIGLAQMILKEAWITVEAGFRPGRELLLTKDETLIGRAEGCDLGLFGDNTIEKQHARIRLKNNRYVVEDNGTPAGTYVNDQAVRKPTPLKSGDLIRVGKSVLRFGERQKR
jgi:hypothetical protein